MRAIATTILLCLFVLTQSFAQTVNGGEMPQPDVPVGGQAQPQQQVPATTPVQQVSTPPAATVPTGYVYSGLPVKQWAAYSISMLPTVLFILFFVIIVGSVGWRKVFSEILTDKEAAPIAITQKPVLDEQGRHVHVNNVPQMQMEHTYPKSASRLILFFSSFTAILISLGIVTGSIYGYLMGKGMPDFSSVIGLVISLGIGIVPYMTSKLKGNGNSVTRNPFSGQQVNYMTTAAQVNRNEPPVVAPATAPTGGEQQQPQQ
ncbi:MAG: hypothetical protein R2800_14985 [Flavipsychrobacter sp.]